MIYYDIKESHGLHLHEHFVELYQFGPGIRRGKNNAPIEFQVTMHGDRCK